MKPAKVHTRLRGTRVLTWTGALVLATAGIALATESLASATPVAGAAQQAPRHVAYLGHTFTVPSGWSVVNLATNPNACVRFDAHAIYFGTPSATQKCAAQGAGPVEGAILVSPAPAASTAARTGSAASAQDNAVEQRITATLANIRITASYGTDRSVVTRILASAGVPAPQVESVAASAALEPAVPVGSTVAAQATSGQAVVGFDTCTAPSTAQMTAWAASSPYKAVGIYIGGADRGCTQPALTASWLTTEVKAGWRLLPIYAGAQVDPGQDEPSQLTSPASQGTASANDAVAQAQALGLGRGSLLYYDMEGGGYIAADSAPVEAFLNAWTARLHTLGYHSAVYGEETGALAVLIADWGKMAEPDVIDVANANGLQNDDPGADTANHWTGQRVHQFVINSTQSYGGVSISIDEDYLDAFLECSPAGTGGVVRSNALQSCTGAPVKAGS